MSSSFLRGAVLLSVVLTGCSQVRGLRLLGRQDPVPTTEIASQPATEHSLPPVVPPPLEPAPEGNQYFPTPEERFSPDGIPLPPMAPGVEEPIPAAPSRDVETSSRRMPPIASNTRSLQPPGLLPILTSPKLMRPIATPRFRQHPLNIQQSSGVSEL